LFLPFQRAVAQLAAGCFNVLKGATRVRGHNEHDQVNIIRESFHIDTNRFVITDLISRLFVARVDYGAVENL
jgi:hypothetical protein